jgi:hypothetical protein
MVQRQLEIEQRNHDAMKTLLNRARALAEAGSG